MNRSERSAPSGNETFQIRSWPSTVINTLAWQGSSEIGVRREIESGPMLAKSNSRSAVISFN